MKMRFLYSQKHRDHSIVQTTRLVTISALSCPAQANNPIVKGLAPTISSLPAFADGEWHGHSDDKHEKRLDQVPAMQAIPEVVLQLPAEGAEQSTFQGRIPEPLIKAGRFSDEHEHRHAAEKIE